MCSVARPEVIMRQTWSAVSSLVSVITLAAISIVLADNMAEMSPAMNDYAPSLNNKAGSIQAAVNTMYNLEVRKIATKSEPIPTQKVEIESNNIPLLIHFKSQSSKLKVIQTHKGGVGETQKTMSEDEPDILIHEVKKPIFQQVKEIIVPYRKTVQEIRPVQEQMETIVSRSHPMGTGNTYRSNKGEGEGDRQMMMPLSRPMPYMKEAERFMTETHEETSDRLNNYLPMRKESNNNQVEENLVNEDFELDPSKVKFLQSNMHGPQHHHHHQHSHHFGNNNNNNNNQHPQQPLGPLPMSKVSKPMRRQLATPQVSSNMQRRMLMFSPNRFMHKAGTVKTTSKPLKRKWKIFFLQ